MAISPIPDIPIEDVLGDAFLTFAVEAILNRAIPDVRDGCKPVQRAIMYVMHWANLYPGRFAKVQDAAADVSGKFHPHGDASVADALYKLGQWWVMRYPLLTGQGNFGSPTEPPAAPRYPEVTLSEIGAMMLGDDLDPQIVPFCPTYDDRREMPTLLPSLFPNVICNGQAGIAVGMASITVPHNLSEVCDALILLARDPDTSLEKIMKVLPGPDFPTGAFVIGTSGIRDYFEKGRGTITLQGKVQVVPENGGKATIIVTEFPYGVSQEDLIKRVAKLVADKKIDGVDDAVDLSDCEHPMRVEFSVKRGFPAAKALEQLYQHTQLRTTISVNNNVIGPSGPVTMGIIPLLRAHIDHRLAVIVARCRLELGKAEVRIHLLEGFLKALGKINEVIRIVRGAADRKEASELLQAKIGLDEVQAREVLDMTIARLTKLAGAELEAEVKGLRARAKELAGIIGSPSLQVDIFCAEVSEMKKSVGDARRTTLVDQEPAAVSTEDLIQAEQDAVIITRSGRIKRVPLAAFQGKKGEFTAAEEADISGFFVTHPHDEILIFTSAGRFFRIKGHAVNVETRNGKGADLRAMLSLVGDEAVIFSLMDRGLDREATFVATCTEFGMMKRTSLSEYSSSKPEGIAALKLEGKDRLRWVALSDGKKDLMAFTAKGLAVRFPEGKVRAMGRPSLGVTGIRMGDHDEIISFAAVSGTEDVMTVSSSGRGKRTPLVEYRATERGNRGIVSSRLEEGERLVGAVVVADADKVVVRTEKGNMSVVVSSVKKAGRATKGGKVVEGVVTGMEKVTVWER